MSFWRDVLILIVRIAISLIYLWAGYRKLFNWNDTEDYMRNKQTKWISFLLPIAVTMQILGGLSLLLGVYARIGAAVLILFTLGATIQMHDFWNLSGKERVWETAHFLKDIAIIGGLLLFMLLGSGRISII